MMRHPQMPKPKKQTGLWSLFVAYGNIFQCEVLGSCMCWISFCQLHGVVRMEP